jgi:hypothetical protein
MRNRPVRYKKGFFRKSLKGGRGMRYQSSITLILFIVLIMSFPVTAMSQGNLTLNPKVSGTLRTDGNFYKAETDEREVRTSLVQPGFELDYETAKSRISLDYTLNVYDYEDKDALMPGWKPAEDEDYVGHRAVLDMRTKPTDRLTLGLSDSYYYTRDPAQSDIFSNSVTRNKYYINRLTPMILYDLGPKFSAGFRYRHTQTDYSEEVSEGSTENRGIFDLVYNFNRTTSLDLEYQYWNRDYKKVTSDYDSGQIRLILRKQYKYFRLEAGAGYHERNFDRPGLENIDVFTYRAALTGQNPPEVSEPRSHITLVAETNFNDSGTGERYFKATRYSMEVGRVFMEKLLVDLEAVYQNSDYEKWAGLTPAGTLEIREDDTTSVELKVGYILSDYMVLGVAAGNQDRESNIAGRSYDNDYLLATLDIVFRMGRR